MKILLSETLREAARKVALLKAHDELVDKVLEGLSDLEHEQWASWVKNIAETEKITPARVEAWKKLWKTPYKNLSEEEKDKDREWGQKAIDIAHDAVLDYIRTFLHNVPKDWNYILPEELKKKMDKGETKDWDIIDVRKPEDYKAGHIPGAINIYWQEILDPKNLPKLSDDGKIVVYCYLGHTSSQVMVLLRLLGYDVISLKFGMGKPPVKGVEVKGWLDFGYEVEK